MKRRMKKIAVSFLSIILTLQCLGGVGSPVTAHAAAPGLVMNFPRVNPGESEYAAFERIGQEFYNKYIKDKYKSTAAVEGGAEKVFTLESVYAFEYAMNKDFLNDEAVAAITSGATKLVDLPTYAETLNVFCAEACEAMPYERISTDSPFEVYNEFSSYNPDNEWHNADTKARGTTTPDFGELSLLGYDPLGSSAFFEYIYHYANIGRGALWQGKYEHKQIYNPGWKIVNPDGNMVFGWTEIAPDMITVQSAYCFELSRLCNMYNTHGYSLILSDNRFYVLNETELPDHSGTTNVLQTEDLTLNFSRDMRLEGVAWYDALAGGEPDDRDVRIVLDSYYGVHEEDFAEQVGQQNLSYLNLQESGSTQKIFNILDISLPIKAEKEYEEMHVLTADNAAPVSIKHLETAKLSVGVEEDIDGWYADHVRYISSDPDVAYVDQSGTVYGITEGSAVITAFVKSAGRCRPVQFTVYVTSSVPVNKKIPIGFATEDAFFLGGHSDITMDSLADRAKADGGAMVLLVEQPMFYVNGRVVQDTKAPLAASDVLTLDRWTQYGMLGTMSFEEYKRLAEKLHANNQKLYITFQSNYSMDFGNSVNESSYTQRMLREYREDPKNEEASCMIGKLMDAYEAYFMKYGAMYQAAGVDGLYINDNLGVNFNNYLYDVPGERWATLIQNVRKKYKGEIWAYCFESDDIRTRVLANAGLLSNVDGIAIRLMGYGLEDKFTQPNTSVSEWKKVVQDSYLSLCDELYSKYQKPISTEWYFTSTRHPASDVGSGGSWMKGKFGNSRGLETEPDNLQHMKYWQAVLELLSEKPYTYSCFSIYHSQSWKSINQSYEIASGYDCRGSAYKKPVTGLFRAWNTEASLWKTGADAGFSITGVGSGAYINDNAVIKTGDPGAITTDPDGGTFTYNSWDKQIADVDANGNITAKSPGKVVIEVINTANRAKKYLTIYVLPGSVPSELFTKVHTFVQSLKTNGYPVEQDTLWKVTELAVRINEPELGEPVISAMVDARMFEYTSTRQYSAFVESLKNYSGALIDTLKLTGNTSCTCSSNADYIKKYIIKDPYNGNLNQDCERVEYEPDPDRKWEMQYKGGGTAYGWSADGDCLCAQDMVNITYPHQPMYLCDAIITGDRIYFLSWCLLKKNIRLNIGSYSSPEYVDIPLEEDGGICLDDFKKAVGDAFYNDLMGKLEAGTDASVSAYQDDSEDYKDVLDSYGFRYADIGYPTDSVFDFSCPDIVYDGTTSLAPNVTKNYSKGAVTFRYRKADQAEYSTAAPKEAGEYIVRGECAANGGYRKQICEKTVKISQTAQTPTTPPALTAPGNVQAALTDKKVTITWTGTEGARRYKIVKRFAAGEDWQTAGYSGTLSFSDRISCGKTVEYAVLSLNYLDSSDMSAPSNAVVLPGHSYGAPVYTWSEGNAACQAKAVCENCMDAPTEDAASTNAITKEATRTEEGEKTFTAEFTNPLFQKQTRIVKIPVISDDPGDDNDPNKDNNGDQDQGQNQDKDPNKDNNGNQDQGQNQDKDPDKDNNGDQDQDQNQDKDNNGDQDQNPDKDDPNKDNGNQDNKDKTDDANKPGDKDPSAPANTYTCRIAYNLNGGENAPGNPAGYEPGTGVNGIKDPARTGYTFAGWYTDSACKKKFTGIEKTTTGNLILYAKWTANKYNIKFDRGEAGVTKSMSAQKNRIYDTAYTLPACKFKKAGAVFIGWGTDKDGRDVKYLNCDTVKNLTADKGADVTLYARWLDISQTKAYTVTYKLNGGVNAPGNPSYYEEGADVVLQKPVREGYEFLGWCTKANLSNSSMTDKISGAAKKNVTLYAKWKPLTYTVKFVQNPTGVTGGNSKTWGGRDGSVTGSMSEMQMTMGKKKNLLKNGFRYEGYTFAGWNTEPDGSGRFYKNKASVKDISMREDGTFASTVTLYAQWTEKKLSIKYDLGKGKWSGGTNPPTSFTISSEPVILPAPTRKNKEFAGWFRDKGCTEPIESIPMGTAVDVKVYAKWN